jgi:hypothetical protein
VTSTAVRFATDGLRRFAARRDRRLEIVVAGAAALACIAIADPHRPGTFLPRCPTKLITGLDCPACGGLRLAHDLLHGDLEAAIHDNPFLLLCSPALAVLLWRSRRGRRSGVDAVPDRVAYSLAGAAAAWTVVRNLPGWPLKPTVT